MDILSLTVKIDLPLQLHISLQVAKLAILAGGQILIFPTVSLPLCDICILCAVLASSSMVYHHPLTLCYISIFFYGVSPSPYYMLYQHLLLWYISVSPNATLPLKSLGLLGNVLTVFWKKSKWRILWWKQRLNYTVITSNLVNDHISYEFSYISYSDSFHVCFHGKNF